jgi:6-pyruvoyltetrahydropterin/6-carboxytetrahydropterin synthase
MKIAKEFRWEMGHRLKFHQGKCINLHGHSYKMMVEFTGEVDENGMVLDYYDVKEIVAPLVDDLDHGFLVYENDTELLEILKKLNSKHTVVKFESTAENLCKYFLEKIAEKKLPGNIKRLSVKVFETENTYAEEELII